MNRNKEITLSVRMSEDQLRKIDQAKGDKTRSQFVRDMMDQPQNQDSSRDDTREREIEREEREREERNQNREEQLRKEAAARGPPQQPQQKEEESPYGWIKELTPVFLLRMLTKQPAPPQPLITPELLTALRPKKKCVTITDGKTGAIHEIPVDIYFQMQNQGITVADIDAIIQKHQQKGD